METLDWREKRAAELREEAGRLEAEAKRPLPDEWKVGMRVRFLRHEDWAWSKGTEATIVELREEFKGRKAHEYQVFYTQPDSGKGSWWTTPDDVELVD